MFSFFSCVMQHTKRSIKKIPPTEITTFHTCDIHDHLTDMHHRSLYKKAYMHHVKVLTSVEPFIAVLNRQCTDIGIVFHCKHNLMHSYIQSLKPILKILKFKYLQIPHKAYLSPFLVTNWPQRHNLFHENPLTPCPP